MEKAALHEAVATHRDRLGELVESRTRQLRKAYEDLRGLERTKDRFLNSLSHEMKTPLSSFGLYLDTLWRQGEFLAPTEVEKTIFRLCMQDEARHVAYGVKHLKYLIERFPEREAEVHALLDVGEQAIFKLTLEPQTSEPRAILAGGGLANIQLGMARMGFIYRKQVKEYLNRVQIAGLDRSSRITIPLEIPIDELAA